MLLCDTLWAAAGTCMQFVHNQQHLLSDQPGSACCSARIAVMLPAAAWQFDTSHDVLYQERHSLQLFCVHCREVHSSPADAQHSSCTGWFAHVVHHNAWCITNVNAEVP